MYKPSFHGDGHNGSVRRPSNGNGIHQNKEFNSTLECGIAEVSIHFRMVIKIDAGIYNALALDDELVIATDKPAALQCIRWTPESTSNQTSTELLTRLPWLKKKTTICEMVYDRPMNLSAWVGSDGAGYAVVRNHASNATTPETHKALFSGYEFHECGNESRGASKIAINARFSLIVVGCQNGDLLAYSVKDYKGPIPYSHTYPRPVSEAVSGKIKFLCFSPDGYCLFVGLENGWMTWSVFGKALASSFGSETKELQARSEEWLGGVKDGFWLGGGTEILLLPMRDNGLWILEMARSACTGVHNFSNSSRCLLQTSSGLIIYKGHGVGESSALLTDSSLWHHVQAPRGYLNNQWPIRFSVISEDGRYLAIAGRRGLAHYSVQSGRWKSFQESDAENEFAVRGGMFWHGHLLVVAVECATSNDVRL